MFIIQRINFFWLILLLIWPFVVVADELKYRAIPQQSEISFEYKFGNQTLTGKVNDFEIDAQINFQNISNSSVSAAIDTATMTGGFIFATEALRSPKMLDVKKYPKIKFNSLEVSGAIPSATIKGLATIKGISKPIDFDARWVRPAGTSVEEINTLIILATGALNRFDFGVDGYSKEVDAELIFNMRITIEQF